MTTGNEKLGIQLEVEPIQAGAETFAELRKALDAVMGTMQGMSRVQKETTAAAKATGEELKRQKQTVEETVNSFKAAVKLDVEKVDFAVAKKALEKAIKDLHHAVSGENFDLNIELPVNDNIKEQLEKQIEKDKADIAKYQKEIKDLFKGIGMTESKASGILAKAAQGDISDPEAIVKINSIAGAYEKLASKIEVAKATQKAATEKLADVTSAEYKNEETLTIRLLKLHKQLQEAKDHSGIYSVQRELEALQALGGKYDQVRRAIELLDQVKKRTVVSDVKVPVEPVAEATTKAVKSSREKTGGLISAEDVTRLAALAEQVTTVLTPFIARLNSLEELIVKGTSLKLDTVYTEIMKVSRVLEAFSQQVEHLIAQTLKAADKAMAPHQSRAVTSKAAQEYNAAHKAELQEYASYVQRLNELAAQIFNAERQARELGRAPAGSGFGRYLERAKGEAASLAKEFDLLDAKANQLKARLDRERKAHIRDATTPLAEGAPAAQAAAPVAIDNTRLKEAVAILESARKELNASVKGLDKTGVLTPFINALTKIQKLMSDISYDSYIVKEQVSGIVPPVVATSPKELKELTKEVKELGATNLSPVTTGMETLREKAAAIVPLVREIAEQLRAVMSTGGVGSLPELATGLRAAAGGGAGGGRYHNRAYADLMGPDDAHVRDWLAAKGGGGGNGNDGDGNGRGRRRGRYLNRDYSDLMDPDEGHVQAWYEGQDKFLAKQIKNKQDQQKIRDEIARLQALDDAKEVDAKKRRLQKLQEIYATRMMKSLEKEGLDINNGEVVVADKTYKDAFQENERRKQAALRRTAQVAAEVAAERARLEEKLARTVFDLGGENQRRVRLGKPEVMVDAAPVNSAIEAIRVDEPTTLANARNALARLKREIREQTRDLRVDLKIGTTKEGLERATDKLKGDYEKMVRKNPSYQFPAIDFGMDNFKGPLSEVQERFASLKRQVAEAKAQFEEVRGAEEKLGKETIRIVENTNRVRNSLLREQQARENAARKALIAELKQREEDRQTDMNLQAGTVGVKYKPFGNGFVRANMDTSFGSDRQAYNNKFDTDAARNAQQIRNINAAIDGVRADALRGIPPTVDAINAALKRSGVAFKENQSEFSKMVRGELLDLEKLGRDARIHLQSQLRGVSAEVHNGSVRIVQAGNGIAGVLQQMGRRLVEFYTLRTMIFAIGNEFRTAFTGLMDLNQGLHDTIAIAGAAGDSYKSLEEAAIGIAKSTKFSAKEVTEGMKVLAQAGVEAKDLPGVTRVTALLATGSGATFEQASQILTTGMNVWKVDGADAIKIANTFTAALNSSKLEIGELGTAFNYLASQSKLSGRSLVETTALIAVLKNQGQQASTIGTSMSNFLGALLAPNKKLREYLKDYNIKPEDVDPTKRSLVEIVRTFEEAAARTGISVKDLFKTFDKRVARGTATLFEAGSDQLEMMEEKIKNTNAAVTAWAESMKGIHAQFNILRTEFADSMNSLIKNFSGLYDTKDAIRSLIVGFRDVRVQITLAAGAIGVFGTALVQAFSNKNYVGIILTGISVALAAIATKAGEARRELQQLFNQLSQDVAESAGKYQRTSDALQALLTAVKKAKPDKSGILQIDKTILADAVKADERFSDVNLFKEGNRKALVAMIKQSMKQLGDETDKAYDGFIERYNKAADRVFNVTMVTRNEYQRLTGTKLPEGMRIKDIMERIKDEAEDAKTVAAKSGNPQVVSENQRRYIGLTNIVHKYGDKAEQAAEGYNEQKTAAANLGGRLGVVAKAEKVTGVEYIGKDPKAVDVVARAGNANSESLIPDQTGSKPDPNAALKEYRARYAEHAAQLEKDMALIDKKMAQLEMRDRKATREEVFDESLEIEESVQKAYAAERKRITEKTWNDIAKAAKSTVTGYDKKGEPIIKPGKGVSADEMKQTVATGHLMLAQELEKVGKQEQQTLDQVDATRQRIIGKHNEKYESTVKKLEEDSLARQQQAETKMLDLAFKDRSKNWDEKVEAFNDYKEAVTARYAKDEEDKLREWEDLAVKHGASPEEIEAKSAEISTGFNEKRDAEIARERSRLFSSVLSVNPEAEERNQDRLLRARLEGLHTQEKMAWTAKEINGYQQQALDAEQESLNNKQDSYMEALEELKLRLEVARLDEDTDAEEKLIELQDKYNGKLDETSARIREIIRQRSVLTQGLGADFLTGVQEAWQRLSDMKALTQQFGAQTATTMFEGTSDSIAKAIGTVTNPDNEKINDLKLSIQKLQTEKNQLQTDINTISANTSKTPQEIAELSDKRAKLAEVNNQIDKQKTQLGELTNAWTAFSQAMKNIMKTILDELNKYIAKMLVVKMIEGVTEVVATVSGAAAESEVELADVNNNVPVTKPRPKTKMAEGGYIPLTAGKANVDSVPLMAMPGEFMINKDSVNYYGPQLFAAYNSKKIQKLAEGGMVGGGVVPQSGTSGGQKQPYQITLINVADPTSVPRMTGEEVINIVSFDAAKKGAVYKTIKGVVQG